MTSRSALLSFEARFFFQPGQLSTQTHNLGVQFVEFSFSELQAAQKAVDAATAFISTMGIPKIADAMATTAADIPMLKKETLETTGVPITPETAEAVWQEIYR